MEKSRPSSNAIVDKIIESYDNMMLDCDFEELENKKNIVLLRSAKEEVLCRFLERLDRRGYEGNVHIIGRKSDERYREEYENLTIFVNVVDDKQRYTVKNTREFIKALDADAICFLYQEKISLNHDNLLQIVNQTDCSGYAISNQLNIVKLIGVERYLTGKQIYMQLCDWFYTERVN